MSEVHVDFTGDSSSLTAAADAGSDSVNNLNETVQKTTTTHANYTSTLSTSTRVGDTALMTVDRLQISQDIVTNATIRQELAQTRLSDAVSKYGANSEQARKAQQEMTIATDNLTVAHTRQEERMAATALIAIPRMIAGLKELGTSLQTVTRDAEGNIVATEGLTAATAGYYAVATLGIAVPAILAGLALVQGATGNAPVTNNLYGNQYITASEPSTAAQASTLGYAQSAR